MRKNAGFKMYSFQYTLIPNYYCSMDIKIITNPFNLTIHGFSGIAANKDYAGTAFKLSGKMWQIVKEKNLKNKGLNIWLYEANERVFAGVELDIASAAGTGLEQKDINLSKYAYYKHIGSYTLISRAGLAMREALAIKGVETTLPYIEIYGHWNADETKQETELFVCLK